MMLPGNGWRAPLATVDRIVDQPQAAVGIQALREVADFSAAVGAANIEEDDCVSS